jgi:hypothetical protein
LSEQPVATAFRELLERWIAPSLKSASFARKRWNFSRTTDQHIELIQYQRSLSSTGDEIKFTVNVGIASKWLLEVYEPEWNRRTLMLDQCHWTERLGYLLPERDDVWWTLDANTAVTELAVEHQAHVEKVILPTFHKYSTDESLAELWLSGEAPGLTEFQRGLNLAGLLKAQGRLEELERILDDLRRSTKGTSSQGSIEVHLELLDATRAGHEI